LDEIPPSTPDQALAARLLELATGRVRSHAAILIDPAGSIVGWLPGAEQTFGYSAGEMIGRSCDVIFTPEDIARGMPRWERETAVRSGLAEDDRWQLRKDGARIWVTGTMTAIRDDDGVVLGFAKLLRDRTDLKTHVEALESRIAALQEAEQRRVNFTSTLAHELRSPLSAVSTAALLLERRADRSPETQFAVGSIRRQVDFMARVISDLVEVARSTLGKTELHAERIALQAVIRDACEASASSIRQRGHRLQQLLPEAKLYVDADAVRLRQVFINLIENAAKYTPPGGNIWVKATTEGDEAVVKIADDGIGIAPEVMPHIFELFTQAETASKSGLGIGLALVKEVVALHGGTVQAMSDGLNKGSEFTVRLRLPPQRPEG